MDKTYVKSRVRTRTHGSVGSRERSRAPTDPISSAGSDERFNFFFVVYDIIDFCKKEAGLLDSDYSIHE